MRGEYYLTISLSLRLSRITDTAMTSLSVSLELLFSSRFCLILSKVMDSRRISRSYSATSWSTDSPDQMPEMFSAGALSIISREVTTAPTSCLVSDSRMSLTPGV